MQRLSYLDKVQRPYRAATCWGHDLFRSFRWPILVLASILPLVLFTAAVPGSAWAAVCGDTILDPGEECDDGNLVDGDCCSASCTYEAAGSPCEDDGEVCTNDVCDGAGLCSHPDVANQTVLTFPVGADTYSDNGDPTGNFGDLTVLNVDGSPRQRIYLRFDVSGISGLFVQSAIIRMQTTDDPKAGSPTGGDIHTVSDNTWDESTLTHENRPDIDGPLLSSVGEVGLSQTVDFDVTAALAGDGTYNFGINPGSNNGAIYYSREADAGQPELIITLGTSCTDGNACTQSDTCVDGSCVGADPIVCTASDQCHDAGTCDPATGECSDPDKADGSACDDADACTQSDTCVTGICVGADPVVCTASDQCHDVGTCDPATGECSDPDKADGSACNDADACTLADSCVAGICVGADPIVCTASDHCYAAGTCDPATGLCSDEVVKEDGSPCDDANPCTQTDTCIGGACSGSNPVICTASDQCHDAGICDPATGLCSDPDKADGSSCDDGNACTQTDTCIAGICAGANPVICSAADQCHDAGTCNPATGQCSNPAKADGSPCDDGNPCTQTDTCVAGSCAGSNPVNCAASDQCHDAGICDPATGLCSDPDKADGSSCDDGNACTQTDTCIAGVCAGANPVICSERNQCRDGGTCDPATGQCSSPAKADGSSCDDANACTANDVCTAGECMGESLPDSDGDGFCDVIDLCPQMPDPAQTDADNDGVGDLCQCTAPAPGRCIGGGGSKRSDCLLEVTSSAPVSLNRRGTKVKSIIRCSDGDAQCDLDGARDGQCTFGVSFCFGNADPRYPRCTPSEIQSMEVIRPKATRSTAAAEIEQALGALGLEVRRRGRVIADSTAPVGNSQCSPPVRLVTSAPKAAGKKASLKKFQLRATAVNGGRDKDQFTLACE